MGSHLNIARITTNSFFAVCLFVGTIVVTGFAQANHIKSGVIWYNVCFSPDNTHGGTDGEIYITMDGIAGSTGSILLDNRGVHDKNDFSGTKQSCFSISTQQSGMSDVGPIISITLDAEKLKDDWCYSFVTVARAKNKHVVFQDITPPGKTPRRISHKTEFPSSDCLGDNTGSVPKATIPTSSKGLYYNIQPPAGKWTRAGSSNIKKTYTLEMTLSKSTGKTLTEEESKTLDLSVEKEAKFPLLGKAKVSFGASYTSTSSTEKREDNSKGMSIKDTCEKSFAQVGRPIIWQWESTAVSNSFSMKLRSCDFACTEDTDRYPESKFPDAASANSCDIPDPGLQQQNTAAVSSQQANAPTQPSTPSQPSSGQSGDGCNQLGQLASTNSPDVGMMMINNLSPHGVHVYWIDANGQQGDYEGSDNPIDYINPNEAVEFEIYQGDAYSFYSEVDGQFKCVSALQAYEANNDFYIGQ